MTWRYWRRLILDPLRVRSVHRINDDTAATETLVDGKWIRVPGTSLAHRDQDHVFEPIPEGVAEQ
jgi:hypothetical protein